MTLPETPEAFYLEWNWNESKIDWARKIITKQLNKLAIALKRKKKN